MLLCDLNCDTGEGIGNEEELMPYITSANIACGSHAGDKDTMKRVVDLCLQHGVAIGAHPSYPDRENFGRIDLVGTKLKPADIYDIIAEQVAALSGIIKGVGASLHHVKPHGALYNRIAWDIETGYFVCKAVADINSGAKLYGLSGSVLEDEASTLHLKYVHEVFADRTYQDDGSLTPRSQPNALIEDDEHAIAQVHQMISEGKVKSTNGKTISIKAETICVHGDGPHAIAFAKKLYQKLSAK